MKKLFVLLAMSAMPLILATHALAQNVPDLGGAKELPPPNTDYQITGDGSLIYEGDIILSCEGLEFPNYDVKRYESYPPESQAKIRSRYKEEYEALARACAEAGFPPGDTLPQTGGLPITFLVPIALFVSCGLVILTAASR